MLSPYYGTEPPPETNIRYSRPPKSLGKTDVQSTNQDRDIAPLARAVIPAKERVPEGSMLDRNPLAMEIYLDTVTPLRRGENTEKITRETYFNFPSATQTQLDLQG